MSENQTRWEQLRRVFIVVLFAAVTAVFLYMVRSFVLAFFMGGIFAGLAHPLLQRLEKLFGGRTSLAATVVVALVVLLVVTPFVFFTGLVASQAMSISESVGPWLDAQLAEPTSWDQLLERIPLWTQLEPHREQLMAKVGEIAGAVSSFLVGSLSAAARGTMGFLFDLFVMLYSMYFLLVQGPNLLRHVLRLIPLRPEQSSLLLDKFVSVSRATLKGTLVVGVVQGGLAGAAFAVAGIGGAAFWGTLMAVLSIIPGVGTALVWVPAVLYLFAVGKNVAALGLLLWCALVVGTADDVLRPRLVGKDTELPEILVLMSTMGGLTLFGAVGFLIGPVIAALFLTVWRMYSDTFGAMLAAPDAPGNEA
jgi:predicted PurR-regulated permease PerM